MKRIALISIGVCVLVWCGTANAQTMTAADVSGLIRNDAPFASEKMKKIDKCSDDKTTKRAKASLVLKSTSAQHQQHTQQRWLARQMVNYPVNFWGQPQTYLPTKENSSGVQKAPHKGAIVATTTAGVVIALLFTLELKNDCGAKDTDKDTSIVALPKATPQKEQAHTPFPTCVSCNEPTLEPVARQLQSHWQRNDAKVALPKVGGRGYAGTGDQSPTMRASARGDQSASAAPLQSSPAISVGRSIEQVQRAPTLRRSR